MYSSLIELNLKSIVDLVIPSSFTILLNFSDPLNILQSCFSLELSLLTYAFQLWVLHHGNFLPYWFFRSDYHFCVHYPLLTMVKFHL